MQQNQVCWWTYLNDSNLHSSTLFILPNFMSVKLVNYKNFIKHRPSPMECIMDDPATETKPIQMQKSQYRTILQPLI